MSARSGEHRFRLGKSKWWVWRDSMLRSTGFPVSGLTRLSATELADRADAYRRGTIDKADLTSAYQRTLDRLARELDHLVADDRLREATIWEQAGGLDALNAFSGTQHQPWTSSRREMAEKILGQWQRYCGSNDTIGFFGPLAWVRLDPEQVTTTVTVGPELLAQRRVFLEPWALAAFGARLTTDPTIRRWLPPRPKPHHFLAGTQVLSPDRPPARVTSQEAAAISLCDGRSPGVVVAAELVSRGIVGPDQQAADQLLEKLVSRRLLDWDANLPIGQHTEEVLSQRISAIADARAHQVAAKGLDRLRSARDAVAKATGDPDALARALGDLDQTFTEVAQRPPRRHGWTYPGHAVCYEDTIRDVGITVGGDLLDSIWPALSIPLQAARWLTAEVARRFEIWLTKLVAEMGGSGEAPTLASIWNQTVDMLLSDESCVLYSDVLSEFMERWSTLLNLGDNARSMSFGSDELWDRAQMLFAAERPGWSMARVHSPDIMVCAPSLDDVNSGAFTAVLGELHIAYATSCRRIFTWPHSDPLRLLDLVCAEYERPRLIPLMPRLWSDYARRPLQFDEGPRDRHVGFAPAAGFYVPRLVPTPGVRIDQADGRLTGTFPNGSTTPLVELFGVLLSMCVTNAMRDAIRNRHMPRITIDKLVVWRETWHLKPSEIEVITSDEDVEGYLAARHLVSSLGLPERCFFRLSAQRKPVFVDFTNPLSVSALRSAILNGRQQGMNLDVSVSEMLPDTEHAWLRDADDDRYLAEFRLLITDSTGLLHLSGRTDLATSEFHQDDETTDSV